jgi:hypothetical protein
MEVESAQLSIQPGESWQMYLSRQFKMTGIEYQNVTHPILGGHFGLVHMSEFVLVRKENNA